MQEKHKYEVYLNRHQMSFLEEMAKNFGLEDGSKALRCLVNFAIDEAGEVDSSMGQVASLPLCWLLASALALVIYGPALHGPFI